MADVLREDVDEVGKYAQDVESVDYLRELFYKLYTQTLGEYSYRVFGSVPSACNCP
jgi:hypothetical protein